MTETNNTFSKPAPANITSEASSLLVDIHEAATILRLTVNQFRGCISRGEIVVTKKVGISFYFSRKYLIAWAEKATV